MSIKQPQADIPPFRDDGYLPVGIYPATEAEVPFRFGSSNRRRRRLTLRLRLWIGLARDICARRMFVDGSFVTAKPEPNDVDAVMLVPADFGRLIALNDESAVRLEEMFMSRQPEEIFAAEDESDWLAWVDFFSRTRETDGRRKGLVEILL